MSIQWDLKSKDMQANFGAFKQAPSASNIRPSSDVSTVKEKTKAPNEKNSKFEDLLKQEPQQTNSKKEISRNPSQAENQNLTSKVKDKPSELGKEKITAEAKIKENQSQNQNLKNTKINQEDSKFNNSLDRLTPQDPKPLPTNLSKDELTGEMESKSRNALGFAIPEQAKNLLQQSSVTQFLKGDLSSFDANSIVDFVSSNPFISKILSSDTSSFMNTPQPLEQLLKDWGLDESAIAAFEKLGLDKEQLTAPAQLLSILGLNADNVRGEIDKLKSALESGGLSGYIAKASKQRARASENRNVSTAQSTPTAASETKKVNQQELGKTITDSRENPNTQAPNNFKESSNRIGNRKENVPTSVASPSQALAGTKTLNENLSSPKTDVSPTKTQTNPKANLNTNKSAANLSDVLQNLSQNPTHNALNLPSNGLPHTTEKINSKNITDKDPFKNFEINNKVLDNSFVTFSANEAIELPASDLSKIVQPNTPEILSENTNNKNTNIVGLLQSRLETNNVPVTAQETQKWFAEEKIQDNPILPLKREEVNSMLTSNTNWMDQIQQKQIESKLDIGSSTEEVFTLNSSLNELELSGDKDSGSFSNSEHSFSNREDSSFLNTHSSNNLKILNNEKTDFSKNIQNHLESMNKINQSVVENASMLLKEGGGSMQIDLKTPDLGELKLAIHVDNKNLELKILTENQSSRDLLAHEIPKLKEQLSQQNISLKELSVGVGANFDHQHSNQRHEQMKDTQNFIQSFGNNPLNTKRVDLGSVYRNIQRNIPINPYHNGRIQIAA